MSRHQNPPLVTMTDKSVPAPAPTLYVRAATPDDVHVWRALRLDGIERHPQAFILTADEAKSVPIERDAQSLEGGHRFLAFLDDTPVGLAGLNRLGISRARHRAEIGPLYVIPGARGKGVADGLISAIKGAAHAAGIWQLELSVFRENQPAIALYERHGFAVMGKIPNAILGALGPEDDLIMVRTSTA